MHCPKCHGLMRTYNRSGVQIEQCDNCRGIFLDYGELEALSRLEGQHAPAAPPPPAAAPGWGAPAQVHHHHHGGGHYHRPHHGGLFHMLFTT